MLNAIEIVGGVLLLITSLLIIIFIMLQESKQANLSGVITGAGDTDSFYGKNGGRTKEATLKRFTKVLAIVFFILTFSVNLITVFLTK